MAQPAPANGQFVYGEHWSELETDIEYLAQPLAPIPTVLFKELFKSSDKTIEFYLHLPPYAQFAVFYCTTMQEDSDNVQELQIDIACDETIANETKSIWQSRNSQITIWNPIDISSAVPNRAIDKAKIIVTFHNEDEGSCYLTAIGGYFL